MIASVDAGLSETGDSAEQQVETQLSSDQLQDGTHRSNVSLSDSVSKILAKIPDSDVADELKHVLLTNMSELSRYQFECAKARSEAEQIREKLHRTEVELSDLQSAAALMVAGQDDAFVTLQRRYDEELASWRSISEQQIAEAKAASQQALEHERANWAGERNALLAQVSSVQRKFSLEENAAGRGAATAVGSAGSVGLFSIPDKLSGQQLANQARESVERMARRVRQKVLSNNILTQDDSSGTDLTRDATESEHQTIQRSLEMHEREVVRLRQMLKAIPEEFPPAVGLSSVSNASENTPSAPASATVTAAQCTVIDAYSSHESGPTNEQTSQPVTENTTSHLPDDGSSVITDLSWVQLQSRLKDLPKQPSAPCVMCMNYEQQLQNLQLRQQEKEKNLQALGKELSKKTVELNETAQLRTQLETELQTRCSGQNERINQLESRFALIQQRVESILTNYQSHRQFVEAELVKLSRERQTIQTELDSLQNHYDALLGRRATAAKELSEKPIQLPSDKTELELLALRMYEENLSLREAREHLDERLKSDSQFRQQQLIAERQERINLENTLQRELDEAHVRLASLSDVVQQRDTEAAARLKAEEEAESVRNKMIGLQTKLSQTEEQLSAARAEVTSLQQRIMTLQSDLDNVESVQADFVRLSQNLQVQLERLRQQDNEVRWIDPDDVSSCFACEFVFPSGPGAAGRKANCRHCGKVHCAQCLKNSMPSGPVGRAARVCDVCYTLLNKHVAPYFSTSFQDPSTGAQIRVGSPNVHRNSLGQNKTASNHSPGKLHSLSPNSGRTKTSDVTTTNRGL